MGAQRRTQSQKVVLRHGVVGLCDSGLCDVQDGVTGLLKILQYGSNGVAWGF